MFVNLEKAYGKVPREKVWHCMRKYRVTEKYIRPVQDMYEGSDAVVRNAMGMTKDYKVEAGLHQGSFLSPFFAMVMDRLTGEIKSPWTLM